MNQYKEKSTYHHIKLEHFHLSDGKERAAQIFKALQNLEIDTAIALLDWASCKLLQHQKCEISPDFLQEVCE